MSEEVVFITKVRSGGGKGTTVIMTLPKEIVDLLKLGAGDYVKISIKKIKPEEI